MKGKNSSLPRPLKAVSEVTREHETFRYDTSLVDEYRVNETGRPSPCSDIRTSRDGVMTALAQLGLYQTCSERAFVSLFDTNYQYVVAEAVPFTPLLPLVPSKDCSAPLSCCGTAIPRTNNLCEQVLRGTAAPYESRQQGARELPVTLVSGLAVDAGPLFNPGCKGPSQFYAAVPVRTRRGINIGVYCLLGSTMDQKWDEECSRCIRDISSAIMEHLEARAARSNSRRNERLNRGLGSFLEGESTLSGWRYGPNEAAYVNKAASEGRLNAEQQQQQQHQHDYFPPEYMRDAKHTGLGGGGSNASIETFEVVPQTNGFDPSLGGHGTDSSYKTTPTGLGYNCRRPREATSGDKEMAQVFSKASNIIREAFEVAGCLFFDMSLGSYRTANYAGVHEEQRDDETSSNLSVTSSSDDQSSQGLAKCDDAACELLGYSTSNASSINSTDLDLGDNTISRRFLAKLVRRYPNGKIYTFDATGELQSSESSGDDTCPKDLPEKLPLSRQDSEIHDSATNHGGLSNNPFSRRREGHLIYRAFPGARSVAFMPVWDSKRERWIAGGFVYTLEHTRVFTPEGELSIFQAFAQLIAADVLKLKTIQADKAKSDALGSLSHELRSPMHGIILGTELLNDTELSVFQGSAIHTIETCCRTLLDTMDHLLDYSKVNNLRVKDRREVVSTPARQLRRRPKSDKRSKRMPSTAVMLDGLVEEVADSVFAGFNFQHMSVRQLAKADMCSWMDRAAHHRLDSAKALEELSLDNNDKGERVFHFGRLLVYICVDPSCDWMFFVKPGAMRRIIMNLLGNALKFTAKGTVWIILKQKEGGGKHHKTDSVLELTVKDTGQGISDEYLQHSLFTPFAQENELSSGTGLGLSIVKNIVSQLRGDISVESQVGVGTAVTVTLRLERPSNAFRASLVPVDGDEAFQNQLQELKGMRIRLEGFETNDSSTPALAGRSIMTDICRGWLHLDVTSEKRHLEMLPDIVIWSSDALPFSSDQVTALERSPNIVICGDALDAYRRISTHESNGEGGIFEFISQPVGPRKLAKSILLAYKRWVGVSRSIGAIRPQPSRHQSYSESPARPRTGEQDVQPATTPPSESKLLEPAIAHFAQGNPSNRFGPPEQQPSANAIQTEPGFASNCFLLVDDNNINLKVLSACMTRLGQQHQVASNGQEAVDAYKAHPSRFAGILMDISMPIMDGLEATRRIRAYEHQHHLPRVPVLTLTGLGSGETQREAFECGVDRFLTKPVRLNVLSEALEAIGVVVG